MRETETIFDEKSRRGGLLNSETRACLFPRMAPPWSRLLAKKGGTKGTSDAVSVQACSVAGKNHAIKGEEAKRWWAWRRRRRRPPPPLPPSSHLHNKSSASFALLALVSLSLGALLVSGIASSVLNRGRAAAATASVFSFFFLSSSSKSAGTSYAPPKNWTSPPAAVRVVDGDTIVAAGIVVRLLGMDAPEDGQLCGRGRKRRSWRGRGGAKEEKASSSAFFSRRLLPPLHAKPPRAPPPKHSYDCGAEATKALRGLVEGKVLRCERKGTDRYGRALARCLVVDEKRSFFFSFVPVFRDRDGSSSSSKKKHNEGLTDVGEWMLRKGHAVSYLGFTRQYLEAEAAAKREQRGIWEGGGEFELPEAWRAKRRAEREARAKEMKKKNEKVVSAKKQEKAKVKKSKKEKRSKKKKTAILV